MKDAHELPLIQSWVQSGHLKLFLACSRDGPDKVYVQDLILKERNLIWTILHDSHGVFYLSGNSNLMPQQVRDSLLKCFLLSGSLSDEEGQEFLSFLIQSGHFQEETWG